MKKLFIVLCLSLFIAGLTCTSAYAGTSFAVNSDRLLYGVNLDLNDTDLIFRVQEINGTKIFYVQYKGFLGEAMTGYLPVIAMNSKGLLVACQIQSPPATYTVDQTVQTVEIGALTMDAAAEYGSVDQILEHVGGKLPINSEASLHSLFADALGAALVLETGNPVLKRTDSFTLLTDLPFNSADSRYSGKIEEEDSAGYEGISQLIEKNLSDFNEDKAFEVLQNASKIWKGGGTKCSMVFDPVSGEIFVVLDRDYSKIWKVSLEKAILETWEGFPQQKTFYIGGGVTSSELLSQDSFIKKYGVYLVFTGGILAWIILGSIARKRRLKAFKPKEMEW